MALASFDLHRRHLLAAAASAATPGLTLARSANLSLLIAHDGSASMPLAEFDANRTHALRLLAMTRAGDGVSLRLLEDADTVFSIEPSSVMTKHRQDIVQLAKQIGSMKKLKRGGQTLFRPVIEQLAATVRQESEFATLLSSSAHRSNPRRPVAVFLSDGQPDDPPIGSGKVSRQKPASVPSLPADIDWLIVCLGVHARYQSKLDELLVAAGFSDARRKLFVPPALVAEAMPKIASLLGRTVDPGLVATMDRSVAASVASSSPR